MNAEQAGAYAPLLPSRGHRGSGMKARLPEAAGGRPGSAGRSGPASFSGPSSRTKTGDAAGAGLPVSGALGAALLAAAALLLAPGEARAIQECGAASLGAVVTCSGASYPDGIFYGGGDTGRWLQGNNRINVPGSAGATTTITATTDGTSTQSVGVYARGGTGSNTWAHIAIGGETDGTAHVVNIVQGTSTNTDTDRNNGVYFRTDVQSVNNSAATTIELRRGVTIGSATDPMKQNGLWVVLGGSGGRGSGPATITSAAPIFAAKRGILFARNVSNITGATTITNNGDISSGEEGIYLWYSRVVAPWVSAPLSTLNTFTGGATITNTGAIAVSGADKYGIYMNYRGIGAAEVDNSGAIDAPLGSGIHLLHANGDGRLTNNGAATLGNSGAVSAATLGLRLDKRSGAGAVTLTNSGAVTVTADAAAGVGHAVWLTEGGSGTVTLTNSGALRSKNHALFVEMGATNTADLELTNSAAVASEDGDGIRLERDAEGDVTVDNSAGVSGRWHGIYVGNAARIDFDQSAGTIAGRTGVYLGVTSESASGDSRATDSGGDHDPAIDLDWTGGSIARGTAANDNGRFRAASAAQVLAFDQEAAAVKAMAETVHYGGAAGIEAHALSWRDVVEVVAEGDDPGAIADNMAQMNLLSTSHADSQRAAILAQFKAALGNADLEVADAVLTAIGTTATTAATELTDAEIVTYLSTDDAATRTLLRNVLAQGLTDDEKLILRAVVTNDDVDATLTAAGFTDDTADPNDYWSLVKALLDRHHLDDVSIAMTAGSIDSRGDGIRAYYATPHASNGAVEVTVGAGASVTGGKAGVYAANGGSIEVTVAAGANVAGGTAGIHVANAGDGLTLARKYTYDFAMGQGALADQSIAAVYNGGSLLKQVVTVAGTVTGGTDAGVRLSGGAVIVEEGGSVRAGSSGVGIKADGAALVYVDGEVRGGAGGAAAVHLEGGGTVTVGLNGRVRANGATHAIQRDGTAGTTRLTLITESSRLTDGVPYRDDLIAQVEGSLSGIDSARLREYANGVPTAYSLVLGITGDGMLDTSKFPSRPTSYDCTGDDGRCRITEAGTISGRTGVYAAVPSASTMAPDQPPLIDVAWTATFTHGEASSVVRSTADALVSDREAAAMGAVEETIRWGAPAGIEAHALSWRDVAAQVAKGDDPFAIADNAAQTALLATSGAASRRAAILAQFRAALGNADHTVANAVLVAIGTTATTAVADLTDMQIVTYLSTDDMPTRALLRNVLAQGLSDKEKAVLAAVAAGDATALTIALNDADAGFPSDYKAAVQALLERYNAGDVRVRMTGGSIDSRGDGIRAYYATPHDMNGGISVTVAAGTTVTGGTAGVYVANAGTGLMVARKYTYGFGMNDGATADDPVAVMHGEGAAEVALRNQLVTVAGTVTGGTDAAVHLDGGGAVLVMEGGKVHAGSSGVAIKVNDPGPALVYIDGEVRGAAGGAAAVHLSGGGSVTVGLNGRVQANNAARAIRSDGTEATTLTLVTNRLVPYREDVNAQVEGSIEGVEYARLREDRDGVPTGYSLTLTVDDDGLLDTSKLPSRPEPPTEPPVSCPADGRCIITQAGTISGRTGVYAAVPRASAEGETRAAAAPPLIDVTWTGTFSHGEGSNDRGRFEAKTIADVLSFDRESAAGKAVEETVRWDAPAGIEAHALSWRDVMTQVAKGDDPGAIADATAQMNLLSTTHADSRRAAILAQLRAALGNEDLAVAAAVLTAIDSTATTAAELTDEDIVTYLGTDDGVTRALLRDVLAQGLSDAEKAVLRAVATGDGAGLATALDDADAGFSNAYKTAVKALLDRYNVGDVRIAMNAGSIDSRGDGIRAYYATPHDDNGAISVSVAEGASVTGAMAGIYVANAGGDVTVESGATIRAGTDGIRVVKPGTSGDVTITTTGGSSITATDGAGIHPQDNAGHTGTVTVTNAGDVTAGTWGILANRLGAGTVSVTSSGGTVFGMTEPGIFAANKAGDANSVTVGVMGGTVRSAGRNKPAIHAWNRGTGDLDVAIAAGATAISKHAAGVFARLGDAAGNRVEITQGGTIEGRTGVYARVAHGTTAETPADSRTPADVIDIEWTGTFSHGTAATVAPDDVGRFSAATAGEVLAFDRETVAVKAVEETIRWDAPAGIEAQVMSWRDVASVVATGDDPGEIADDAARALVFDTTSTDAELKARSDALVRQAMALLDNEEIMVEAGSVLAGVIAEIDTDGTEGLSEAEIAAYLADDDDVNRTGLRTFMAQGLSEGEKEILRAVAAGDGDGVDDALTAAGFTDDPADDEDYWSRVKALLDRYNVGDIRIAVNGGSIGSIDSPARGDGIRAYYATPHASNGGIRVTVAAGTTVTGGKAGVYVANAGSGLMLEKKYTPGYTEGDAPDEFVAVTHGEGADAVPLLNQLVTVAGMVTGGTDAAVHLNGGGAVIVMEGGKVHAGSSGVAIKVNDPGPALVYIDGEVRGRVPAEGEAPAPAAVHLPGGGSVIVGLNGKVEANGAARAIRGGGDAETMVTLTLVTDGIIEYREDAEEANARVEGSIAGIEKVRYREDRDGVPTGYTKELPVQDDGDLPGDLSGLPSRPDPGTDTDMDGIRVTIPDDNDAIRVTVAEGESVTGARAGIYVANAGEGLMLPRKYTFGYSVKDKDRADELVAVPLRNQLVTVAGTVIGGTDAAVHLVGGGAVIVMKGGKVHAGSFGVAIKVNDPGPALVYVDGEVKGGAGGAAAVHLTGGGSVIVGLNGSVKANGAARAIRGGGDEATMVALTLVTDGMIENPEDAEAAYARVEGSLADVDEVRFRQDRDGVPTGYDKTLPVDDNGMLDTSELPSSTFSCDEAGDRRCRLYEALPSMLLAMNGLPSYAERTAAARDGNGGWARVEMARGEWQAKKAETETMGGGKLAYDHRRSVGRAGVDFLAGESARVGVSVHALRGKAEMGGVGEVELDGMGGGLSATWLAGGLYVDAQAAVTLYDVDVESSRHGKMPKKDVYGAGYGLGVDVGRRMSVGGMFVTPRAGVGWSKVELDDFTDMERAGGGPRAEVSVEDGVSVKGRLGVMLEMEVGSGGTSGQVFGSLDVEGEFSDETEAKVGGEMLKTEVRPTAVRLGLGGEFEVAEDVVVRATAGFRTSGSGTSGYGGGLELRVRF